VYSVSGGRRVGNQMSYPAAPFWNAASAMPRRTCLNAVAPRFEFNLQPGMAEITRKRAGPSTAICVGGPPAPSLLSGFAPHALSGVVGGVEGEEGRLARMFWRGSPRMILAGNAFSAFSLYEEAMPPIWNAPDRTGLSGLWRELRS